MLGKSNVMCLQTSAIFGYWLFWLLSLRICCYSRQATFNHSKTSTFQIYTQTQEAYLGCLYSTLLIIHLLVFRLFDSICKYIEPACPLVQNAIRFQCCSLKLSTMFCELCILLGLLLSRFKKEKCKKEIELIDKISGCIFVYKYHRNCCCCCPELVTRGLGR